MAHHKALQTYLTALLNVTHDPMVVCSDMEFPDPVPRSVFGRTRASMDVVLAYSNSNPREMSTEYGTTRHIPPSSPPEKDGWFGVGFEVKTSSRLVSGDTGPRAFKAGNQLFDYRGAGYAPVLVAPRKNLEKQSDGLDLEEDIRGIDGACVECQVNSAFDRDGDIVQEIMKLEPDFRPQDEFQERVDDRLGFDLVDIFQETPILLSSDDWWDILFRRSIRRIVAMIVPEYVYDR